MTDPNASRLEDVLNAFAMEETHAKATLDSYLTAYPQYAGELIDLSRELMHALSAKDELSGADLAMIDAGWLKHAAAQPKSVADPFATLSPTRSREIAVEMGIPRQVVTSFRERRIQPASVPRGFLRRFAGALSISADDLSAWLSPAPAAAFARSYRSDAQPGAAAQLSFEHVLIDAGVSDDDRARLLADVD